MLVNILFHDNCFDGASAAAVFLRFYQDKVSPAVDFSLHGMAHQAGRQFYPELFSGDENAIVDFKYASSDRLTWWFDHHYSAFLTPEDERHFRADHSGKKFYDPTFKSCTKFMATITAKQFGFACPMLDELIYWANIIDGALYQDAQTAVEMREPAQKLMTVIEANKEPGFLHGIIRQLAHEPLNQVASQPAVLERYWPLHKCHDETIRLIKERARCDSNVLFFDLSDTNLEGYNKFIPYYLHPEANYSVSLLHTSRRMKISVGWNPWSGQQRQHNLARICERHGGGGHAVVAAISFPPDELEKARQIALTIADELMGKISPALPA
jgi:hypothetical protein